ncbi:hypothetical protein [Streptomyces swartbergensis]|nr:hypothetical protein [Streptomyces swartbergensis]
MDADVLTSLLHDERLRASARAAVAELAAQPGPDQIVPGLAALTAAQ